MNILVFEGIATSGKSTIIQGLVSALSPRYKVSVAGEDQTHIPIMNDRDRLHRDFFERLIKRLVGENPDIIVFDRLYMTQALRAGTGLAGYKAIEDVLLQHNAMTVSLQVQETAIAGRIQKAAAHRESKWGEYIQTRGQSVGEIAHYYIEQQRSLLRLLEQSQLPYKVFDTTAHAYQPIIKELSDFCT